MLWVWQFLHRICQCRHGSSLHFRSVPKIVFRHCGITPTAGKRSEWSRDGPAETYLGQSHPVVAPFARAVKKKDYRLRLGLGPVGRHVHLIAIGGVVDGDVSVQETRPLCTAKAGSEQQRNQETHAFNPRLERTALQPRAGERLSRAGELHPARRGRLAATLPSSRGSQLRFVWEH